ncbi:C-type lectin 37Da-like [Drosophila albomicans]|uniref:C-type lectin 37Da-like n=1 Tax=Drosophila albomicans TaxID=7291 RepID=A0A9C6SYT5_DROAB|nr:C-type lectin 37Da-like [Drosophila albomicans]
MFLKYACILECFGLLSICLAYKLYPIVTEDIPGNTNVTTGPFVRITRGYYFFEMNVKKNWFEAYQSCHLMDAELLSIETEEEWRDLNAYVQEFNIGEFYWTSGTDQGKIGQHVWFANNKPIDKAMWGPNQPDNANKMEHCVEYNWAKSKTGSWINDRPCEFQNRYICEARHPKTASFVVW